MKSLMTIAALALLAGCSGMGTSGGSTDQMHYQDSLGQPNDPRNPYFPAQS